jgi:pSer/pThr/pTyr-binding forkhead associated (FHA) protein
MSEEEDNPFNWEGQNTQLISSMRPGELSLEVTPHKLVQARGPGTPKTLPLGDHEVVLGRSPEADYQIPSPHLSRRHASVRGVGPEYHLKDLESRNGVFLNGVKISSAVLRDGDTIQLGDVVFIYHKGR